MQGFYSLSVIKELRLRQNHTSTPCATCTTCVGTTNDQLIDNTVNTILGELPLMLKTNRYRQYIVYLNYIKTYKTNFVIAAPKCSLKLLSKSTAFVFKSIFKQIESYNKRDSFFQVVI